MDQTRPAAGRVPVPPNNNNNAPSNKTVNLISGIFLLRIWNALGIETFFQPDEYFQSLEPAWSLAFGRNSGAWLTWEWRERLRSSLHPTIFAGMYKLVDLLCQRLEYGAAERAMLLLASPRFLQSIFAACMDIFSYRLACKVFGENSHRAWAVLLLTLMSPWQWFCSTRTLSNCLEAMLTVIALDLWPWDWFLSPNIPSEPAKMGAAHDKNQWVQTSLPATSPPDTLYAALFAAALGCILRPTNIITWTFVSLGLYITGSNMSHMLKLLQAAILAGSAVLALSIVADRWFYNEWVFPPWEFLQFNVVQSLAGFYGTNRIPYYFTEAFILLMTAAAPFALVGITETWLTNLNDQKSEIPLRERKMRKILNVTVCFSVVAFTLIAHKEVRFIYPLLPMMHILAARPLVAFFEPIWRKQKRYRGVLLGIGLVLNFGIGYYGSYIHQRGVIDVMNYLRYEREQHYTDAKTNMTVGFLMPCHSTPWRSHLVYPDIEAWALTCEPPLNLTKEHRADYLDEADVFYTDPAAWIDKNMAHEGRIGRDASKRQWPGYIVFFEQLEPIIKKALGGTKYRECWRTFNTHFHDDWRRKGDVVVWCAKGKAP